MNNRSLAMLLAVVAVALVAYLMTSRSPGPEVEGGPIVAVMVPQLTTAEKAGEAAFDARCASCHGKNAAGQEDVAPPLIHRIYEPGHHGDQAFVIAAQVGVRAHHWQFGDMPPVDGVTVEELGGIITYVRALQRANGID